MKFKHYTLLILFVVSVAAASYSASLGLSPAPQAEPVSATTLNQSVSANFAKDVTIRSDTRGPASPKGKK